MWTCSASLLLLFCVYCMLVNLILWLYDFATCLTMCALLQVYEMARAGHDLVGKKGPDSPEFQALTQAVEDFVRKVGAVTGFCLPPQLPAASNLMCQPCRTLCARCKQLHRSLALASLLRHCLACWSSVGLTLAVVGGGLLCLSLRCPNAQPSTRAWPVKAPQ